MLKTTLIANNISNLTDARYFAAWHIDWLGFDLRNLEAKQLALPQIKEMIDWIEGPTIVGEIDVLNIEEVKQIVDFLSLKAIQVNMYAPIEMLNELKDYILIKEIIIDQLLSFEDLQNHINLYEKTVDYFILDFEKNNINWEDIKNNTFYSVNALKKLCENQKVFLNFNFSPKEVLEIVRVISPHGISLKGGMEEKVGFKSFDEVEDVLEALFQ